MYIALLDSTYVSTKKEHFCTRQQSRFIREIVSGSDDSWLIIELALELTPVCFTHLVQFLIKILSSTKTLSFPILHLIDCNSAVLFVPAKT